MLWSAKRMLRRLSQRQNDNVDLRLSRWLRLHQQSGPRRDGIDSGRRGALEAIYRRNGHHAGGVGHRRRRMAGAAPDRFAADCDDATGRAASGPPGASPHAPVDLRRAQRQLDDLARPAPDWAISYGDRLVQLALSRWPEQAKPRRSSGSGS